ncbi:NS1 protein [Acado virus]|nr:NS1 protein [Acado virus]
MARLIDELVTRYRAELDDWQTNALKFCWELKGILTCSHRLWDCRAYGMCIRQDFENVVEEILERYDRRTLKQLVEVATASMLDGRDIWCQMLLWADREQVSFDYLWLNALRKVNHAYERSNIEESTSRLRRVGSCVGYTYVDDSRSLIHTFFVPLCTQRELQPAGDNRLGRFYILFLRDGEIPDAYQWQKEREIQPMVDGFLKYARIHYSTCLFTGSKAPPRWVVFLPERMKKYLQEEKTRARLLRTWDCDAKFLDAFGTQEAEEMFLQRMGVKGSNLRKFCVMMTGKLEGGWSLCDLQWRRMIQCLEDCFLPSFLVKMYFRGELRYDQLLDWFDYGSECQLCYLQSKGVQQVTVMDVRTAREAKIPPHCVGRILSHTYTEAFRPPELFDGEMLTRVGVHWIAVQCQSVRQAGYVTCTLLHRYLRMDGLGTREVQCVAMYCLVRWYLCWIPKGLDLRSLFRCVLYVLLGKHAEKGITSLEWLDLGSFLKAMFSPTEEGSEFYSLMHTAMISLTKAVLQFMKYGGIQAHENVEEMYPRVIIDEAMANLTIEDVDDNTLKVIRNVDGPIITNQRDASCQWRVDIEEDDSLI